MRLAVCVPCRDQVDAGFAYDLARMSAFFGAHEAPKGGSLVTLTSMGTLICDQRENLAREALGAGADHILWLDSDMRFPKDIYRQLADRKKDIVGCNYATRRMPCHPTAFKNFKTLEHVYTHEDSTGLEEVASMGMGCMLVKADVYKKLPMPWHLIGYSARNATYSGEDIYFCRIAREAGYTVWLDHDASKEIEHIGTFAYRHEHAEVWKDEVTAAREKLQAEEKPVILEAN
jgi:hypothetical protein